MGFLSNEHIITDSAQAVVDPETYLFAMLSSRMHMVWVRAVAGRLETRLRYSSIICYNTFPAPIISSSQKINLEKLAFEVLDIRDEHIGKTVTELYDPDIMPDDLREAHLQLDLAVDRCYQTKPFESDSERLEHLFKMYEQMTA